MPAELAAIVAWMMAKDPDRRPQSSLEVAEALTPFFKKAREVDASPKVDISRAGAVFERTQTGPDAGNAAGTAGKEGETSVAESRWESLIKFRDEEDRRDLVPAAGAGVRTPPTRWPIVVAASLVGLIVLAAIIVMITKSQPANEFHHGEVVDAAAEDIQNPAPTVERRAAPGARESAPGRVTATDSTPVYAASAAAPKVVPGSTDNPGSPASAGREPNLDTSFAADNSLKVATRLTMTRTTRRASTLSIRARARIIGELRDAFERTAQLKLWDESIHRDH